MMPPKITCRLGISFKIVQGPKYIKAAEVNLLMLLETVDLGTYFAWTILKEIPSLQVIFGGIIILLALFFSFYPLKKVKTL